MGGDHKEETRLNTQIKVAVLVAQWALVPGSSRATGQERDGNRSVTRSGSGGAAAQEAVYRQRRSHALRVKPRAAEWIARFLRHGHLVQGSRPGTGQEQSGGQAREAVVGLDEAMQEAAAALEFKNKNGNKWTRLL